MVKPWNNIPILHLKTPLVHIPAELYCLKPHSYKELGAPYGDNLSPWMLREEVIRRLLIAQQHLHEAYPQFCLAIFDAWRPIRVQRFMYEYAIKQECLSRGLNKFEDPDSLAMIDIVDSVERFWALPNYNISTPPPHSTGAAVDLTIANLNGKTLEMGGEIDCMEEISKPDFYSDIANKNSQEYAWNKRRRLLKDIMQLAGFAQHPNEWWHFSYGDQLWAWSTNVKEGYYGSIEALESNLTTD